MYTSGQGKGMRRVHYIYHCYAQNGALLYVGRSVNPERRHKEAEQRYKVKLRLWLGGSTYDIDEACNWEREEISAYHWEGRSEHHTDRRTGFASCFIVG